MGRANASTPPPAGNGLMIRTGLSGQAWAPAASEPRARRPATRPRPTSVWIIRLSSVLVLLVLLRRAAHALALARLFCEILHRRLRAALLVRHAGDLQPHLHAGERARQREVVEVAEVADAKDLPGELRQALA